MTRLDTGKIVVRILTLVTVGLIASLASIAYHYTRNYSVIIAAGSPRAESFIIMRALKTVVERNYPRIHIIVQESGGTADNLARLEHSQAQLATAQGDVIPGTSAALVAILFNDEVQLLVQKTVNVQQFVDLKGKKIALPKSGGQYLSFLFLARHFGLHESDFTFVGADDDSANLAFASGEADALFNVRGLHNAAVANLALSGKVNLVPIEQGPALHIEQPAYTSTVIPQGTYVGIPPVPATDLPTVQLERVLVARRDVHPDVIYAITEVLMERRQEIASAVPEDNAGVRSLLASVKEPGESGVGVQAGVHPGAKAYYAREQRSFVKSYPDFVALFLVLLGMIWLWIWGAKHSVEWRQKARAREFNNTLIQLIEEARVGTSDEQLAPIRAELLMLMTAAIRDLGRERISEKEFQSFRVIWQIAFDAASSREKPEASRLPDAVDPLDSLPSRGKSRWKFWQKQHEPNGERMAEELASPPPALSLSRDDRIAEAEAARLRAQRFLAEDRYSEALEALQEAEAIDPNSAIDPVTTSTQA